MRKLQDKRLVWNSKRRLLVFSILLIIILVLWPVFSLLPTNRKVTILNEAITLKSEQQVSELFATQSSTPTDSMVTNTTMQPTERLVRITDEKQMRKYRFFRLRVSGSRQWLSRPVNTNNDETGAMEKTFQFRYHSGHYEAWSIQGHTRMHLTSEINDRVTVDRLWARGYEMWFVAFGGADGKSVSALQRLLSKETANNKDTFSEGDYLYLLSRRNRRALSVRGDQIWVTGTDMDAARFELFAVDSPACLPDTPPSENAMAVALLEEGFISNLTRSKHKKKIDVSGQKFQSIVRAIMCWGPIPRLQTGNVAEKAAHSDSYPIFGSPKPPTQILPIDRNNSYDGVLIARRTIANWALLEGMTPYLLADKDITAKLVDSVNEDLLRHLKNSSSVMVGRQFEMQTQYSQPTYRGLFKAALSAFPEAPAVMYSNMDILYTPQLIHTIRAAVQFVAEDKERQIRRLRSDGLPESSYKVKGWMIVGQRINYNVPAEWSPLTDSDWADDMEARFARKGEVFESDAEDYFIVSRKMFDWNQIPDFVVGGVAFDNWIVSKGNDMANEGTAIVIDATKTIVALHQNHGKNSKDSHKHPKSQYNSHLAMAHGGVGLGHTSDAIFATEIDPEGRVSVYDKHRLLFM